MIKFWAFIYRQTGWYSPWARNAEYSYIRGKLNQIELQLKSKNKFYRGMSLDALVGLEIGTWQMHNGFTKTF